MAGSQTVTEWSAGAVRQSDSQTVTEWQAGAIIQSGCIDSDRLFVATFDTLIQQGEQPEWFGTSSRPEPPRDQDLLGF